MKSSFKPQRIAHDDIADVAAAGVKRALQARESRMRELTDQEVDEVSGGASLSLALAGPIIAGGLLRDILKGGLMDPTMPDSGMLDKSMTGMAGLG